MSTVRTNNVQVGQSLTATNNFTLYQPTVPDGTVRLGVGNTGATTADVITATSAGNVGIGTSSPAGRLHVAPGSAAAASTNGQPIILQAQSGGTSASGGNILIGSGQNGAGGSNGFIAFGIGSATSGSSFSSGEAMRIDSSGSLLLGVTSPIGSSSNTSQGVQLAPNFAWVATSDAMYIQRLVSDGTVMRFLRGATQVGSISVTATTTTYSTSSDYRLKHDIHPMTGALARVALLKPVTYKWKWDDSDGEGFIAHELQEVCPDAVTGEKDAVDADGNPQYQGIDTSFLVATLTAAIQELTAKVTALEERLASTGQTGQNPT